jgi:hypothetical protein
MSTLLDDFLKWQPTPIKKISVCEWAKPLCIYDTGVLSLIKRQRQLKNINKARAASKVAWQKHKRMLHVKEKKREF